MTGLHRDLTGLNLHEAFNYAQSNDPGAVGANSYWLQLQTGTGPHLLWRRDTANTTWIAVGATGGGGGGVTFSAGISTLGNTAGTTGLATDRLVLVGGSNMTLSQSISNGSGTVTFHAQSQSTHSHSTAPAAVAAGSQTGQSGTIVFANSNGLTFGMSGSTRITGSYSQSTHAHTQEVAALSAGAELASSGTVEFSDSNGVSFGLSSNTLTASYSQSTHSHAAAQTGISGVAASGGTITSGTVSFANSNGLTFGISDQTVTASYTQSTHSHSAETFLGGLAAGTQTGTTGTIAFVDSNGLTFGMSGSTRITGSYSQSTHSHSQEVRALSAGTELASSGTVSFADSNGVTFGMSSNTLTASYSQSTHSHSAGTFLGAIYASDSTATSGTVSFSNSNGLTFGLSNGVVTGSYSQSTHSHSAETFVGGLAAGTQTATTGTIVFADSNGLAFGMSGSTRITGSYTVPTVPSIATAAPKTVSTIASTGTITRYAGEDHQHVGVNSAGISNGGNTSGTSGVGPGRLVLAGGNNMTLSQSTDATGSTVSFSAPNLAAGLGGLAAGTQTATSGTIVFADSNGLTFGMSGSTRVTGSYSQSTHSHDAMFSAGISNLGNTSGTTGLNSKRVVFAGDNNITLSQSTDTNGATLSFSGAAIPAPPTIQFFDNMPSGAGVLQTTTQGNSSLFVAPMNPGILFPGNMTATNLMLDVSISASASVVATMSCWLGIYTLNGSSSLSLLNSALSTITFSGTLATSMYQGNRWLTFHSSLFSTDLTFSQTSYWLGLIFRSTGQNLGPKYYGAPIGSGASRLGTVGSGGAGAHSEIGWYPGIGVWSAQTNGFPASIHMSDLARNQSSATYAIVPHVALNNLGAY